MQDRTSLQTMGGSLGGSAICMGPRTISSSSITASKRRSFAHLAHCFDHQGDYLYSVFAILSGNMEGTIGGIGLYLSCWIILACMSCLTINLPRLQRCSSADVRERSSYLPLTYTGRRWSALLITRIGNNSC